MGRTPRHGGRANRRVGDPVLHDKVLKLLNR